MAFKIDKDQARMAALVPAAVMSLALSFTGKEEGIRTKVYLDSANVPTYCRGETLNPVWGKTYTVEECDTLFYIRLGFFAYMVDVFVKPEMEPEFHAALTSWAYNVGINAVRTSTLVKKVNSGDFVGACNQLTRWKNAGGKPILLKRRLRERDLCLKGAS